MSEGDAPRARAPRDHAAPGASSERLRQLSRLTVTSHPTDVAGLTYVYPVVSRRAGGVSIGVNLNPNHACNWRCVYCQVPDLTLGAGPPIDLDLLERELSLVLELAARPETLERWAPPEQRRLVDVAFSGDGEPTTSPDFDGAIACVGRVLERAGLLGVLKVIVISNGSMGHKRSVLAALERLATMNGEVWVKLDSATSEGALRLNGSHESAAHHLEGVALMAATCPTWVQTCVVRLRGELPSADETSRYLDALSRLARRERPPRGVLLYTLARPSMQPEAEVLEAAPREHLEALAEQLRARGLEVRVA